MENKSKWTWIDTLIVIIVIAVIAVGGVVLGPKLFNESSNEKITFTVMIQEKDEELAKAMHVGDKVTLSLTEKDGGVIKNIVTEPSKRLTLNSIDGTYDNVVVDKKEDVYVTVEANCKKTDMAIKVGDTDVKVGKEIPVRGKGYASSGFVITLDK